MFRELAVRIYENARIIFDPKRIESLAKKHGIKTEFGNLSYVGKVRSRSARFTKNTIDDELTVDDFKTLEKVEEYLKNKELVCVERVIGQDPRGSFNCRTLITKPYAYVAYAWGKLLSPQKKRVKPDFITISVPEWGEVKILVDPGAGVTFALGSDYIGEIKKSFLRMWMWKIKQRNGLGLHAGSKIVRVNGKEVGQLYLGLSATGKTTLTCRSNGESELCQDDVGGLMEDGSFIGSEGKGLYIKTDGLNPEDQPELYRAVRSKNAILENVWVNDGKVDFYNDELTKNGRAVIERRDLINASKNIDLKKVHQIFLLTRNPIAPAVAKLSPEQAAAFFMLGESIETSAGDPSKAGQYIRVVGTNPFIVGSKGEEGNRFFKILRKNPGIECYILNTGEVGTGTEKMDIRLQDTLHILEEISKNKIKWKKDDYWGYEIPESIDGIDDKKLDPSLIYEKEEYEKLVNELRKERIEWLSRFKDLNSEIADVFR